MRITDMITQDEFNGSLKGQLFSGALIFYVNSEYYILLCLSKGSVSENDR